MNWIEGLLYQIPDVIQAVLLLILAWIVASICRNVIKKILKKLTDKKMGDASAEVKITSAETIEMIGSLTFAVVFFLFLPAALERLGMSSVTYPITDTVSKFLGFVPNIIAAAILIAFGTFLAKLVSQIVSTLLKKTKLDTLQDKINIKAGEGNAFSDLISKIVYALILVVFVVAGVQVLGISSISEPATEMVGKVFNFIPLLFAAIILFVFGMFLGKITGNLIQSILEGTGIDKFSKETYQNGNSEAMPASKIVANVVTVVIDIIFAVSAIKVLGIEVLTDVGNVIIAYMPSVLAACLILLAAWAASIWIEKAVKKVYPNAGTLALILRVVIMVLAGFMAVNQLGISKDIIGTLFKWICIGVAAAFAIAFGMGGKDWAKKKLDDIDKKAEEQLKDK